MTLLERLKGCPSGATRAALRLSGHSDAEIEAAVKAGTVEREVRSYSMPHNFKVEWFTVSGWRGGKR